MRANLFIDECDKSLFGTTTLVGGSLLAASGKELDGRVRADTLLLRDGLAVRGFCVDLGNNDVGVISEVSGDFLPGRSQILAV